MNDSLKVESTAGVTTVTLDRPEVHNAFDDALIGALTEAFRGIAGDTACRAVVLTGAGKSFSSGGDLNWMQRMADYDEAANREDARALANLMRTLYELPQPVIARVNGATFGGAVGLVACCDIAVAADTAKFSLSEVRLGLVPATIAPFVVNAIGIREARRRILAADIFDAATARDIGLVHEVVAPEALDEAVATQLKHLMKGGPVALAEAKRFAHRLAPVQIDDALVQETAELIAHLRISEEGQEGLKAFLEKRKPRWVE